MKNSLGVFTADLIRLRKEMGNLWMSHLKLSIRRTKRKKNKMEKSMWDLQKTFNTPKCALWGAENLFEEWPQT